MTDKSEIKELNKHLRESERKISQLEEALEKERSTNDELNNENNNLVRKNQDLKKTKNKLRKKNKDLEKQLAQLKSSAPLLAASDKTAEAGGVPVPKYFINVIEMKFEKEHQEVNQVIKDMEEKKPVPNAPPTHVRLKVCPHCQHSKIKEFVSAIQKRTITDIPPPTYDVYEIIYHRYWCPICKKMVRGTVPWLPPNQEFGPLIACWIAYHRILGLTLPKIRSSLYETYGIKISDDTVLKLEKWVANTLHDDYDELKKDIVKKKVINADETGFRIGGDNAWLWAFVNSLASLYVIAPTRGHKVPVEALDGFEGVLGRDAWKPYDFVKCAGHQLDLLHVNRWLERAEIKHKVEPRTILTSRPVKLKRRGRPPEKFLCFVDGVRAILKKAIEYTETEPPPSVKERKKVCKLFEKEMESLLDEEWKDKDVVRISKELRKRLNMLFTFVKVEGVPWHNNDAERAIRKGVLARKISGGRRTWEGAEVFQVLLSISETAKKNGNNFIQLVQERFGMPSKTT